MIRYRAKVIPLREGRRQEKEARWEYTHAASPAQAQHFLMRRFPYPKYFVEEPVPDPEKVNICPKLIPIRDSIKQELAGEDTAAKTYRDMAGKFRGVQETQKANVMDLMAGQEEFHRMVLMTLVDEITRECG